LNSLEKPILNAKISSHCQVNSATFNPSGEIAIPSPW
jgi:hypothetical protein